MKPFNSKKGVSPLIATILLIAFAASLGAVVMNLGNTVRLGSCASDVSLEIHTIAGQSQIFRTGEGSSGSVEFMITNVGGKQISKMRVWVVGEKDVQVVDIPGSIEPGFPSSGTVSYDFNKNGPIRQVQFFPFISVDNEDVLCVESAFETSQISEK